MPGYVAEGAGLAAVRLGQFKLPLLGTGGTSFIGSYIVERFGATGERVNVLDDFGNREATLIVLSFAPSAGGRRIGPLSSLHARVADVDDGRDHAHADGPQPGTMDRRRTRIRCMAPFSVLSW